MLFREWVKSQYYYSYLKKHELIKYGFTVYQADREGKYVLVRPAHEKVRQRE